MDIHGAAAALSASVYISFTVFRCICAFDPATLRFSASRLVLRRQIKSRRALCRHPKLESISNAIKPHGKKTARRSQKGNERLIREKRDGVASRIDGKKTRRCKDAFSTHLGMNTTTAMTRRRTNVENEKI
jgi:hypothetical protein